MKKLTFNLSPASINKLIQSLNDYGVKFEEAKTEILQALADYAYSRVMAYVPVDTGKLASSFVKEVSGDLAIVYTDLFYAKYPEFGTGIQGASSDYDLSNTNIQSLRYNTDYLHGQPAQKFVYRARLDLEDNYMSIAKSVLKGKGLI